MKRSKRFKQCLKLIETEKAYSLQEAVLLLKKFPPVKFNESVDLVCKLNVDPKQLEQSIRGALVLPHGLGKTVKVCAFCKGEDVGKAEAAGADFAGSNDLIAKIKSGWLQFDKTAATPEMMKEVAQLGKTLGPRGLMPSPKSGTVGADIAGIVKELKAGKVQFKADKSANIHTAVGKSSFSTQDICENISAIIKAIGLNRPAQVKGRFIRRMSISTTMGPAISLDMGKLG
jgi:large subunit ribosomal protein L1